MLFSGSSSSHPPSLYFTRKRLSDTEFPEPIQVTSGIGGVNTTRWGDYFSLVSASPNTVVGIGTVSSQSSFETSVYTHKLTFSGVFMELECLDNTQEIDIVLTLLKTNN